jgi:hypothetical protein
LYSQHAAIATKDGELEAGMSWYADRLHARYICLGFPYQVACNQTGPAFVDLMDNYCSARLIQYRKWQDMRGQLRYCFSHAALANGFADTFGGIRIDIATSESPDGHIWKV